VVRSRTRPQGFLSGELRISNYRALGSERQKRSTCPDTGQTVANLLKSHGFNSKETLWEDFAGPQSGPIN
jgi:hypothetical protein